MLQRMSLAIVVVAVASVAPAAEHKVLFIGIDGCRPDAIARAMTPNLVRGSFSVDCSAHLLG